MLGVTNYFHLVMTYCYSFRIIYAIFKIVRDFNLAIDLIYVNTLKTTEINTLSVFIFVRNSSNLYSIYPFISRAN